MEDEDEVDKRNGVQKAYMMKSKDEEEGDEDKRNWGRRGSYTLDMVPGKMSILTAVND